jgi:hypothetical protein
MLRNHRHEPWQSGLWATSSWSVFRDVATSFDPRNAVVSVPSGTSSAVLQVPALELRYGVPAGAPVTVSYSVRAPGAPVAAASEPATMGADGWVPFVVRLPRGTDPATVSVAVQAPSGASLRRTVSVVRRAPSRRGGGSGRPRRPR